jgi:cell division protein FtsL
MASFADLFNPAFLMFLGILVLVVALLVVYFESKMRDQNHKISSMLSLVSTLAEDINGVKIGLNHLAIRERGPNITLKENLENNQVLSTNELIQVSDDEVSDDDDNVSDDDDNVSDDDDNVSDEDNDDDDNDIDTDNDDDDDDDEIKIKDNVGLINIIDFESDDESVDNEIKVIKLQVSNEPDENAELLYEEASNLSSNEETEEGLTLNCIEEDKQELLLVNPSSISSSSIPSSSIPSSSIPSSSIPSSSIPSSSIPFSTDLKTISINLGEDNNAESEINIDYKKVQLTKLRSIVVEKGLTNNVEALKLKKFELLKLLGVE